MNKMNESGSIKVGQVGTFDVLGETLQGEGVARPEGMALFIPHTFMGEQVKAKVVEVKKRYGRAELLEVTKEAPERIKPPCPVFGQCGGCQLQMMTYERQLQLKEQALVDAFKRLGSFHDVPIEPIVGAEKIWHYRNKMQMHVRWGAESDLKIGYYRRSTHDLIEFDDCLLVPPLFSKLLKHFRQVLPQVDKEKKLPIKHILIKSVRTDEVGSDVAEDVGVDVKANVVREEQNSAYSEKQSYKLMMILVLERWKKSYEDLCTELADKLMELEPALQSFYINRNKNEKGPILGSEYPFYHGEEHLVEKMVDAAGDPLELEVGPASFLQVNPEQTERLYKYVAELAQLTGKEKVLDAYCGVGSISLYLAPYCRSVTGIEEVADAVEDAKNNSLRNQKDHLEFHTGKVEELLPSLVEDGNDFAVCLLDPPRKGCHEKVLEAINEMQPDRIVYVSCDSASLVRDCVYLAQQGWQVKKVVPVDLFPQTGHLECVVLMSRL
ncbi:23S rRNA (uracil(1939)-C(5))-methyltransferase RlmD [Heliorestis acidaminivorans]|uniref:23S rRNA (Uracil(1939)-C(5))-methyltransferase RlmD n=1 Tax=Heliorestis acidaminivorans TaxID=553427 RepID=A0A6I0F0E6_9FIRM|nr:23S rRNA (uracil(1939)-C(5))-methyltransferase RlmD [Heliorestis acidaminivorans]KAB2952731.1 23S rRNA (uracil(1939)-C(5))-methyltransferase RlmD [Heliorestis acidaminivorans]